MTTEAQVTANRANAQKSTGPRTPEGKERASQNSLKHGLFAREAVLRGEDQDEFEIHREMLLGQLIRSTPLEDILAERIVDLSWRLQRAVRDQSEAFVGLYEKSLAPRAAAGPAADSGGGTGIPVDSNHGHDAQTTEATVGRMILEDFSHDAVLERLLRYERRIESSLYRTLNQLRRVHDQVQKAAQEGSDLLERWREEDWNARKARAFASYPPLNVSPGPAGGMTNSRGTEVRHPGDKPSLQYSSPALERPAEDKTCKTNPIPAAPRGTGILPVSVNHGQDAHATMTPTARSQSCKTKPISSGSCAGQVPCGTEVRIDSAPYGRGENKANSAGQTTRKAVVCRAGEPTPPRL